MLLNVWVNIVNQSTHLKCQYDNFDHSVCFYWLSWMAYTLVMFGLDYWKWQSVVPACSGSTTPVIVHVCIPHAGGDWAHSPGGLQCSTLEWWSCGHQSELSGVCLWGSPISSCRVWYSSPECYVCHQFHGGDCVEYWTEINKQHSDVDVFKECENLIS